MAPSSKTGELKESRETVRIIFIKGYGFVTLALQAAPAKHGANVLKGSSRGRSLSGMEMSSVTGHTHLRVINDFIKCTTQRILRQRE